MNQYPFPIKQNRDERAKNIFFKSFMLVLIYCLVGRNIPYVQHFENNLWLKSIYLFITQIVSLLVILLFLLKKTKSKNKIRIYIPIVLFSGSLLLSTIIGGYIHRGLSVIYPFIAQCSFILLVGQKQTILRLFIKSVSNLYYVLAIVNLFFILFLPETFGEKYFLGGENYLGYPLILGLMYICLDSYYNGGKTKLILYCIFHAVTLLIVFSGATLVGYTCVILTLLFYPIRFFFQKFSLFFLTSTYAVFIVLFIPITVMGTLNNSFISYIVEDVLGKDMTFSYRTFIWAEVLMGFVQKPILGHGIQETENLFTITGYHASGQYYTYTYSAHNQFLQTLYEGGILSLCLLLIISWTVSNILKENNNIQVTVLFKSILIGLFIMLMGEAPSCNCLIEVFSLASIVPITLKQINVK